MSVREILLSRSDLKAIHDGATVAADSSDGKVVNLSTMVFADDGRFRVLLTFADLDLIERDPVGLVVGNAGNCWDGWTIRVQPEVPA